MPFDKFVDIEHIFDERRKAISSRYEQSVWKNLKRSANKLFHDADEAWRHTFFELITENPGATFHHAVTAEGAIFLYYRDKDKGLWQPAQKGAARDHWDPTDGRWMKEAIEGRH